MTSEELDEIMGLPKGTCYEKIGVKERYWISDETSSQMGAIASLEALDRAKLKASEVDVIVSTCGVNEQPIPTGGCLLSEKLGLQERNIPCFDVGSSCMSFLQGLDIVSYMIEYGRYNTALICSSEVNSVGINYNDLKSCPLFGDGASAMVVAKDEYGESGIIHSHIETYSGGAHLSEIRAGGNKLPAMRYNKDNHNDYVYELHGRDMGDFIFKKMDGFIERALKPLKMNFNQLIHDCSVVIPHQVSPKFMETCKKKFMIPESKFLNLTQNFGNMLSASIPLGFDEVINNRKIMRGEHILCFGGGSGITLGLMYLQY